MLEFIRGDFDVLIATTIIESGLDIPNANTIIINNGQNFGLSELHQLRGRVGRSNKKAFCYLLTPPLESMTQEARQRLQAIENFSNWAADSISPCRIWTSAEPETCWAVSKADSLPILATKPISVSLTKPC